MITKLNKKPLFCNGYWKISNYNFYYPTFIGSLVGKMFKTSSCFTKFKGALEGLLKHHFHEEILEEDITYFNNLSAFHVE